MKDKNSKKIILHFALSFCILIFTFCIFITPVFAAELYLESPRLEYAPYETFSVDIRLDVAPPENINAAEVYLNFPKDILELVDFSTANSILIFIKQPEVDLEKGIISFIGIIPGGYSGQLIGDPGKSNLLGKAIFKTIYETTQIKTPKENKFPTGQARNYAKIEFLGTSRILLNDGKGTRANLTLLPLEIQINRQGSESVLPNEWEKTKEEDKIPPEDFQPEVVKINNKYFLIFNAQDKQSGINHYEILESRTQNIENKKWIRAESPYRLQDQTLQSYIYVKAVDKAENEKIVMVEAKHAIQWYENWRIWSIIIIIISLSLLFRKFLWKRLLTH